MGNKCNIGCSLDTYTRNIQKTIYDVGEHDK